MTNKKGFSLIELVITSLILLILSGIVYISYSKITTDTNSTKILSNIDKVEQFERAEYIKGGKFTLDLSKVSDIETNLDYSSNINEILVNIDENGTLYLGGYDGVETCYYRVIPDLLKSKTVQSGSFTTEEADCSLNSIKSINS